MNAFVLIGGFFAVVVLLIGGGIIAFCLYRIAQHCKKIAAIEGTVLSDVRDLRPGYCKIVGKVESLTKPIRSPFTNTECVYYHFEVHEQRTRTVSSGPNGATRTETYWERVINDRQASECGVKDRTGLAEIDILDAETVLSPSGHSMSGMFNDAPKDVQRTLMRKYGFSTQGLIFNKGLKYKETVIEVGDKLFVIGDVETTRRGDPLFVKGDDPFIVSDRSEDKTVAHFKTAITWNIVGASAAAVFTLIFLAIPLIFVLGANQAAKVGPPQPNAFGGVNQQPPQDDFEQPMVGFPNNNQPFPNNNGNNPQTIPAEPKNLLPQRNSGTTTNPPRTTPTTKTNPAITPMKDEHPEVPWTVRPDPSPAASARPTVLSGWIPLGFLNSAVIFPTSPSPYVIVSPSVKQVAGQPLPDGLMQAYDLRTMKAIGPAFSAPIDLGEPSVLNPDGAYYAARSKGTSPTGTVNVWSTKGGLPARIVVDTDPKRFAFPVDFAGKDRLLTMCHDAKFPDPAQEAVYQVWDLTNGKEVAKFKYPLCFHRKWGTISAGGKYFAMERTHAGHYQILAWDTTTGKQAAKLQFQGKDDKWGQATGMAFSPDGKELAMIWRHGDKPANTFARIYAWDTSTGKKVADYKLGYEMQNMDSVWGSGGPQCLQYLPDNSGWLIYSHLLIDRKTGSLIGRVGTEPKWHGEMMPRTFLTKDYVTATAKSGLTASLVIVPVKGK